MTPEQKVIIDAMTQEQMAWVWRFAPTGDELLQGDTGEYFFKEFKKKGWFTPEISKRIGLIKQ